jgi:hypothetical protein
MGVDTPGSEGSATLLLGVTSRLLVIRPKWQVRSVQQQTRQKLICTVGFMAG